MYCPTYGQLLAAGVRRENAERETMSAAERNRLSMAADRRRRALATPTPPPRELKPHEVKKHHCNGVCEGCTGCHWEMFREMEV
jgi:hypothetical protein